MNPINRTLQAAVFVGVLGCLAGVDRCTGTPPHVEAGRYWAHIAGYGTAPSAGTAWFQYRPSTVTSWGFVPRTPPQVMATGADLSLLGE